MDIAVITGSAGLVGSEAAEFFCGKHFNVIGLDNDLRQYFFGEDASVQWNQERLINSLPNYTHHPIDIRHLPALEKVFTEYSSAIKLIIHAAAQPSHDWAAREPLTDFGVNAAGTLNLLELARRFCPKAVFVYLSTNKVYGDRPNSLPLVEQATRWELPAADAHFAGIDETMSIDGCTHSLFGASKLAADILVQEYGRYFDMNTVCFRAGCLTGPQHSGAALHGFLAYLMKCAVTGASYTIFGYKGKQVRDNLHSRDLIRAIELFYRHPRKGEVYNIGGGRQNNCSLLEAADLSQGITGRTLNTTYAEQPRKGDHIWYISDFRKFKRHYPVWNQEYTIESTMREIYEKNVSRWEQ